MILDGRHRGMRGLGPHLDFPALSTHLPLIISSSIKEMSARCIVQGNVAGVRLGSRAPSPSCTTSALLSESPAAFCCTSSVFPILDEDVLRNERGPIGSTAHRAMPSASAPFHAQTAPMGQPHALRKAPASRTPTSHPFHHSKGKKGKRILQQRTEGCGQCWGCSVPISSQHDGAEHSWEAPLDGGTSIPPEVTEGICAPSVSPEDAGGGVVIFKPPFSYLSAFSALF